jgi:hypothetical protein
VTVVQDVADDRPAIPVPGRECVLHLAHRHIYGGEEVRRILVVGIDGQRVLQRLTRPVQIVCSQIDARQFVVKPRILRIAV